MRELSTRQLLVIFNLVLTLMLTGCGGASPLGNGEVKTGLTGKAGSEKKFSMVIPDNTEAIMVQAAGSENISLQVVDKDNQIVSFCPQPDLCTVFPTVRGTYTVKLQGLASYSNVSLSAAWGGPSIASLQNNLARVMPAGVANAVGLNSFYIANANVPAKLQLAGVDRANITAEIIDANNNQLMACPASGDCLIGGLARGLYFVRHTASANYTDINMTVSWGGAESATLRNGVPLTQLSGTAGRVVWHSFYIPANTDAFMVQGSQSHDFSIDIYDSEGMSVDFCTEYDPCSRQNPAEGLYSVAVRFHANVSSMSLVAAWGGPAVATLGNAVPVVGMSGNAQRQLLHSLFVPAGTEHLAVQLSGMERGFAELLDRNGNHINVCDSHRLCSVPNPEAGAYFVRVRFDEADSGVSLVAAWAGPNTSMLANGVSRSGLFGEAEQQLLHSLYIPAGVESLAVQVSGLERGFAELLDSSGYPVSVCDRNHPCRLSNPMAGGYFVRVRFDQADSGVSLVASWAGPGGSTLTNAVPLVGLSGETGQQLLHSLYVQAGIERLLIQLSGMERGFAEIMDGTGNFIDACDSYQPCSISNPNAGVYFVRVRFDQPDSGVSLVATWAGPNVSSMTNGALLAGLSGEAGQQLLHSMYVPTGVERLLLQVSGLERGFAELLDSNGNPIDACDSYRPCNLVMPAAGAYFVRVRFDQADSGVSFAAIWAGAGHTTLANGVAITGLSGEQGQQVLQSLYVPTGVEQLMVQLSGLQYGFAELLDSNGNPIGACDRNRPCSLTNPTAGAYFVRVRFDQTQTGVSLVAAWAGPDNATLTNGVPLNGLSGEAEQQLLQSLYVPMGVGRLVVQPAGLTDGFTELLDRNGYPIHACDTNSPCVVDFPAAGAYFVRLRFFQTQSGVSVLASW